MAASSKVIPATALYRVFQVLTEEMDRDLPITIPLTYLRIAMAGDAGVEMETVQRDISASSSGITRTTQVLSDRHYLKDREGLNLIERVISNVDLRRRTLRLTPKGERLLAKCVDAVSKIK